MKVPGKDTSENGATFVKVFVEPSANLYLSFKKKKKRKNSTIESHNFISGTQEIESQSLLSMGKKSSMSDNDSILSLSSQSSDDSFSKKKKKRKYSESDSLSSVIEDSFASASSTGSSNNGKKKKYKNGENLSLPSVIEDSFTSIASSGASIKKNRHKNSKIKQSESLQSVIEDSFLTVKSSGSFIEENDSISIIDSDDSVNNNKKKKNKHKSSEIDDSQLPLNVTNAEGKKKKKKQKISENDESLSSTLRIEPSFLTIDSNGSLIEEKKQKDEDCEILEIEPSLISIDSDGSFIEKKKTKKRKNSDNEDVIKKRRKHSEIESTSFLNIDESDDGSPKEIMEKNLVNSEMLAQERKNGSDEEKSRKNIFVGSSFCSSTPESTPRKHKKNRIRHNGSLDGTEIKEENDSIESLKSKSKKKKKDFECIQEKLSKDFDDIVDTMNSESDQEEMDHDNSNDDFYLKLAVSELSKDVDFHIPELHKILNRASKPTTTQRDLIKARGIKMKMGKFTKDEDEQIKENWENFVKITDIKDKPHLFFCMKNTKIPLIAKQNFLYYLSRNLPERTPCSIFNRFKLLMEKGKKGRFSNEEDKYIMSKISTTTNSYRPIKEIAEHLKRTPLAIEHRIVKLTKVHKRKIKWKKRNAAAFIKYLLKATNSTEVEDLRNRPISRQEWDYLSKKLDGVPVRILVRAWKEKLHPALYISGDKLDLRKVKVELVKMFKENGETDWRRVNWRYYASKFEGLTYLRVYSLLKQIATAHVPEAKRGNLKKCIKILSKMPEERFYKHMLYKMVYKSGAVRELRIDDEKK